MAKNDKQIKKLSEEIKGTLKSLFEMAPPPAPGNDPLADPLAMPGQDPMAPADPNAPVDPMAPTDPMAPGPMGMDDLNGGAPDGGPQVPADPSGEPEMVPVPEPDQANLNAIGTTPSGEVPGSSDSQKVVPEPNVNILGTENRDQTSNPLPNFVLEAFGGAERAKKVVDYLMERAVLKYDVKKGANTTHSEQDLHDVIVEKLAAFLEKKQDEFSSDNVELRKELAGLEKKVSEVQKENIQIKDKYLSILKEFGEVLGESHSYLKRNELNWKVYSLAISDERKAQAVREMSSMSLQESEIYLKRLQKLEESASPSARPRRYNTAETAKLREFVRASASSQDVAKEKPLNESAAGVLTERMLRNAGILVEED